MHLRTQRFFLVVLAVTVLLLQNSAPAAKDRVCIQARVALHGHFRLDCIHSTLLTVVLESSRDVVEVRAIGIYIYKHDKMHESNVRNSLVYFINTCAVIPYRILRLHFII